MIFLASLAALAWHISTTSAFYPYHLPALHETTESAKSSPHSRRHPQLKDPPSIELPLHRVPVKRNNAFTITPAASPSAANSAGIAQDGSDYSYMCEVKLGVGKKSLYLLLDTAAVNTWVMSADCTAEACGEHTTFGTRDSSSLKTSSNTFSISYGSGSVSGNVASDDVTFIGKTFPMSFGLASNVSTDFLSYPMDGIMGVGLLANVASNPNGVKAPTIVDVLYDQKIITSKVFGMRLSRASGGQNNGVVSFGAPDTSAFSGDLNYITIKKNNRGFWEIPLDSAKFDGKTASIQQGATVLLDSGTSFMLIPPSDAQAVHDTIPSSSKSGESFLVPCDTKTPLVLGLGGKSYEISPADYIGAPSGGKCASNIIGRTTFDSTQWLVGDVFLKNVYTVYDADAGKVGFASLKGSATGTSASGTATATGSGAKPSSTTKGGLIPPDASGTNTTSGTATATSKPKGAAGRNAAVGSAAWILWFVGLLSMHLALFVV